VARHEEGDGFNGGINLASGLRLEKEGTLDVFNKLDTLHR
jgi:hypothetical protein